MYLLEGLVRWNENRGKEAVENTQRTMLRCYSAQLQHSFNQLTQELMGETLVEIYTQPGEYTGKLSAHSAPQQEHACTHACHSEVMICLCTGEIIGVEYLYSQTGAVLQQDLGRDPDTPDGMDEAEDLWEQEEEEEEEVDEGFLEELTLPRLQEALSSLLDPAQPVPESAGHASSSQSGPADPQPMQEEEEDVSVLNSLS